MLRTSDSDPIRVDFLPLPDIAGRVGMTIAPGKRDGFRWARDLEADLDRLVRAFGMSKLVSLIEDHELEEYEIPRLYDDARARGVTVLRLPIRDVSIPKRMQPVADVVDQVGQWARSGATVVIHCIGGRGRTGTIAGCVLVAHGLDPEEALRILPTVRNDPNTPETSEQREFVRRFAQWQTGGNVR